MNCLYNIAHKKRKKKKNHDAPLFCRIVKGHRKLPCSKFNDVKVKNINISNSIKYTLCFLQTFLKKAVSSTFPMTQLCNYRLYKSVHFLRKLGVDSDFYWTFILCLEM